jgi:hypothetical protein
MIEYAMLSAESARQIVGGWINSVDERTVLPLLGAGLLVWLLTKAFGGRSS